MKYTLLFFSLFFLLASAYGAAISDVAGIAQYMQIYQLNLPDNALFATEAVPYGINNSGNAIAGGISRIAYYLELGNGIQRQWIWVSMNAFSQDLTKIGLPTYASGAVWQITVSNMNIQTNVSGITTGSNINTGNIEFWPYNYGTGLGVSGIGGNSGTYDFNDTHSGSANYSSMQIHNYGAGQVLLAYNSWGADYNYDDVGIGNNTLSNVVTSYTNSDWTFSRNAANYTLKNLEVWVEPTIPLAVPEPATWLFLMIFLSFANILKRRTDLN